MRGYTVVTDVSFSSDHPASDLSVEGLPELANGGTATLRHRLFADQDLLRFLSEALPMHNPNYGNTTQVPKAEHPYVLMKATALVYRALAADSARRKQLETDAKTYLALAEAEERQYSQTADKMHRVLPSPKADESKMGSGDIVTGTFFRQSLRTGTKSNYRNATPPTPPKLNDPIDGAVQDTAVQLTWSQARDEHHSHFEVWRGTSQVVERSLAGRLQGSPLGIGQLPAQSQFAPYSTAKQVFGGGLAASPVYDGFFFWTLADTAGGAVVNATFVDGTVSNGGANIGVPLEPDSDYYYRVFSVNRNGEIVPSEVKRVRTRPMRGRFKRTGTQLANDAFTPATGPLAGGTVITVAGTDFAAGMKLMIGDKACSLVSYTSTSAIFTSPAYTNPAFVGQRMDMALVSNTGLVDLVQAGWVYT